MAVKTVTLLLPGLQLVWMKEHDMPDNTNNTRIRRRLIVASVLASQAALTACADPSAGRTLFDEQCSVCHRAGASALHTSAAEIPDLLQSGSIRPHRFQLSDGQLRDLEAYLAEVQAGR